VRCARSGPPRQQPAGPSPGGNSCEPALTGQPAALARWAGKAGARSADSRRVAKWKRQVGYPVTVGGLGCSSTNFVPPECSAARDGPRTKPPGGNRLQCSREPSGSACQATPSGGPHKPVRKRGFGVAEESVLRVGNCCGHSPRYPPRFLSYSTRAPQKPPQKPPGIRAILEVLRELLVSLPHPRQR
jgi:hypothetical protein